MGNIGTMSSAELEQHIAKLEQQHRRQMRSLRALLRAREEEETANQGDE